MYNIQVVDMKELVDDIIRAVQVDANILVFVNDDGERTAVRDAIFGWFDSHNIGCDIKTDEMLRWSKYNMQLKVAPLNDAQTCGVSPSHVFMVNITPHGGDKDLIDDLAPVLSYYGGRMSYLKLV